MSGDDFYVRQFAAIRAYVAPMEAGPERSDLERRITEAESMIGHRDGSLDAAWAEAKAAALPKGWYVKGVWSRVYRKKGRIFIARAEGEGGFRVPFLDGHGDTPSAALRALTAKVREVVR